MISFQSNLDVLKKKANITYKMVNVNDQDRISLYFARMSNW